MALIEKFHILAAWYPQAASQEIIEGMLVKLNSGGEVILATGASGEICIGVAGDTKSTSVCGLPDTNAPAVGMGGLPPYNPAYQNRVSDNFDETRASGRMTVYQNGGVFATNQYVGTPAVNNPLYVDTTGKFTATPSTSAQIVAYCTKAAGAYPSGVPGIDIEGSITLGNYIEFKLVI